MMVVDYERSQVVRRRYGKMCRTLETRSDAALSYGTKKADQLGVSHWRDRGFGIVASDYELHSKDGPQKLPFCLGLVLEL